MNRNILEEGHDVLISKKSLHDKLISLPRDKVYKDQDFRRLGLKFDVTKKDGLLLKNFIKQDAEFLRDYDITDYSLLVSIYKFSDLENLQHKNNYRIFKSNDEKFLYCFCLVDFLTVSSGY